MSCSNLSNLNQFGADKRFGDMCERLFRIYTENKGVYCCVPTGVGVNPVLQKECDVDYVLCGKENKEYIEGLVSVQNVGELLKVRDGGGCKLVEVKGDRSSLRTGNIAYEVRNHGGVKGWATKTLSDYVVFYECAVRMIRSEGEKIVGNAVPTDKWVIDTRKMRKMIAGWGGHDYIMKFDTRLLDERLNMFDYDVISGNKYCLGGGVVNGRWVRDFGKYSDPWIFDWLIPLKLLESEGMAVKERIEDGLEYMGGINGFAGIVREYGSFVLNRKGYEKNSDAYVKRLMEMEAAFDVMGMGDVSDVVV